MDFAPVDCLLFYEFLFLSPLHTLLYDAISYWKQKMHSFHPSSVFCQLRVEILTSELLTPGYSYPALVRVTHNLEVLKTFNHELSIIKQNQHLFISSMTSKNHQFIWKSQDDSVSAGYTIQDEILNFSFNSSTLMHHIIYIKKYLIFGSWGALNRKIFYIRPPILDKTRIANATVHFYIPYLARAQCPQNHCNSSKQQIHHYR